MIRWGVVATVKAPATDILKFAAHHLDLGATRIIVFLDMPNPEAADALSKHPLCRVVTCDSTYWRAQHGKRPVKHQVRQTRNATFAYAQTSDIEWLAHLDVDEFLVPEQSVAEILVACPAAQKSLRVRPMEALAPPDDTRFPTAFKQCLSDRTQRQQAVARLYPEHCGHLKGGFLSHIAGKLFVRTGQRAAQLRIHKVLFDGVEDNTETEPPRIRLAHLHAPSWRAWKAHYAYRLRAGAYRADLPPAVPAALGGGTLHDHLMHIESREGEAGLRRFFDTVCADTPAHRAALAREGLLYTSDVQFGNQWARHFPSCMT